MKNISFPKLIFILAFTVAVSSLAGQMTYTFIGPGVWHDAFKWFCDYPSSGTNCPPPWLGGSTHNVPAGDSVFIEGSCVVISVHTVNNSGVISVVNGSFHMDEIAFINNNGVINIDELSSTNNGEGGTFNLNNSSTLNIDGSMSIATLGNLNINSGSTINIGPMGYVEFVNF